MGIGVTFAIITGGIDLSIGSVVALTGTVAVMVAIAGVPIWLSWIIGLLVGVVTGLLKGFMITRLKLPPFICDARHDAVGPRGCPHDYERGRLPGAAGFWQFR